MYTPWEQEILSAFSLYSYNPQNSDWPIVGAR